MDFELSSEQRLMQDAARRAGERDIAPILARHSPDEALPQGAVYELLEVACSLGIIAARVPEENQGGGMRVLDYGLMLEQLPPIATMILMPQETTITRIFHGATEDQRERLLPDLMAGRKITCTATTEPDVGSEPRAVRTRARDDGDHVVLDGRKMWISNAGVADVINVTAKATDTDALTRVIVDRKESPFETRDIPVLGLRQASLGEVSFSGCRVPRRNVIGDQGDAARSLTLTWLANRPFLGLVAVSLAQQAFDMAVEYTKSRSQFGQKIGAFQLVQERLAEIETAVVTSRLLCYHALAAIDRGERANGLSAMAKRYAVNACLDAVSTAMHVHGAIGLSRELKLEQLYRDVRVLVVPDGTNEILSLIQGRQLTGFDAFRPTRS